GDDQAEQAGLTEQVEEILRVGRGGVDLAGPGRDLVLRNPAHGGLELQVLRREVERHRSAILPAPMAATGCIRAPISAIRAYREAVRCATMVRAVAGGIVTTTGGRGDVDLTAPDLRAPDGDDIVVVPDGPTSSSRSRGRMRALLVGAIVLVV